MSAAELRKAAGTLRERAGAATKPESMHPWGDKSLPSLPPEMHAQEVDAYLGGTWGIYYATVHPGVGLALADWLLNTARAWEFSQSQETPPGAVKAMAVARLINGGAS